MIKTKLMLTACASALLAACTSNAPEIPDSELYARKFVKEFGVMDSRQDWNNASRGNVQVSTSKASRIRVTTVIGSHNYLLADYADVQGKRTLEFDIPKGITDITVSDGTSEIATKVGGSAEFGERSRVAITNGNTDLIEVVDIAGKEFGSEWMIVPWIDATRFTRKMPEGCYNGDREGVETDFMFRTSSNEIIIRPLYWQTSQTHTLGLYYFDDEGKIVHVPVWHMDKVGGDPTDDLVYSIVRSNVIKVSLLDSDEDVKSEFPEGLSSLKNRVPDNVMETRVGNDVLADISYITKGIDKILRNRSDTHANYNYLYRWTNIDLDNNNKELPAGQLDVYYSYRNYDNWRTAGGGNEPYASSKNWDSVLSKGIKVKFNKVGVKFGAYIQQDSDGKRYYSIASRNPDRLYLPKEGAKREKDAYDGKYPNEAWNDMGKDAGQFHAATWKGTKYGWVYLGFEDWPNGDKEWGGRWSDMDLNDLVFIIDGLDPSEEIEVVNPNEPDDPDPEPTPIKWLVACEDLGAMDDFDFNDVVFEVEHVSGQTKATITPLAAGGTLETYLMRNDVKVNEKEWHSLFGGASFGSEINASAVTKTAAPFEIDVPEDFTLASSTAGDGGYQANMGGFHIKVMRADGEQSGITPPGEGEAPQMLLIYQSEDKKWCWPKERHNIKEAYPKFTEWMTNGDYTVNQTGENWYDQVSTEHVVTR